MYGALAMIMVALAANAVVASRSAGRRGRRVGDQLSGFVVIGSGALVLLAGAVFVLGLFDDRGARAEGLAMFALFTYVIYLLAAYGIHQLTGRMTTLPEPVEGQPSGHQPDSHA